MLKTYYTNKITRDMKNSHSIYYNNLEAYFTTENTVIIIKTVVQRSINTVHKEGENR